MGNFVSSLEKPGPALGFLYHNEMGVLYWGLCLLKMIIGVCDFFLDLFFGYTITKGTREERELARDYENSAQIASIMGRGSYTLVMNHQLHHFSLRHEKYVHPKYILEHDNVTLQGITPSHAFFCVSEPDVNVYDTSNGPFLWIKQYLAARRLVVIPHSTLHRLAAEVGDPIDRKLTLINMTCRCGSTLLCQMINTVPRVRTMSEPWSFNHLHSHYVNGKIEYDNLRRLVHSVVRLQCKRERNTEIDHILIKMNAFAGPLFPMLNEMYPDATYMFNTRLPVGTMASYAQIVNHIPIIAKLVELLTGSVFRGFATFPYDDERWWKAYYENQNCHRKIIGTGKSIQTFIHEGLLLCYGGQLTDYQRHKDIYQHSILFEDVIADPEREIKKIFDLMHIDHEHVPGALESLKEDSQRGTFGPRGKRPKISDEEYAYLDTRLRAAGVDPMITCKMDLDTMREIVAVDSARRGHFPSWPSTPALCDPASEEHIRRKKSSIGSIVFREQITPGR